MSDTPEAEALPPSLRFLKWLVIALTLTMIGGVITVVSVIVTRMPQAIAASAPTLPDSITLPNGVAAEAVTMGRTWFAIVTSDDRILIYSRSGELRQTVTLK